MALFEKNYENMFRKAALAAKVKDFFMFFCFV
jgi:hypothetical protein